MAVDIVMPQMGESIFEGTITKWLKKPGDKVERDEPLFEISTDKVDAEIPSPSAGVLKEIKVAEGKTVPIQTVVGVIEAAGAVSAAPPAAPAAAKGAAPPAAKSAPIAASPANGKAAAPAQVPAHATSTATPAASGATGAGSSATSGSGGAKESGRIHSSPLVRRMAKEHGIDLSGVAGTGSGGRISKQDIEVMIAGGGQAIGAQAGGRSGQADGSSETEDELEEAFNNTSSGASAGASAAAPPPRQAPAMPPPPAA